ELGCSRVRPTSRWSKSETSDFDWGEGGMRGAGLRANTRSQYRLILSFFPSGRRNEACRSAIFLCRRSFFGSSFAQLNQETKIIGASKQRGLDTMDRFSFGPRDNGIIQIAYTVGDIQNAMRQYTELLNVGPWFLVGPFVPPKGLYRGAVTPMRVSLGL